eukprot:CAMPEP_0202891166 /NCGR_PEP_ID=MMETSP1392-20130828/1303_1 /ASSEMBLY_ACC=CAM_ASM_000868 /TAXON_ID=225041 /ORGANISM="Chlamydomonas chlamydogama, Strain SAG 11-48b" /LENGTH=177 /DNA_ID=CAMNT_0049574849 /DNA_START=293 /DNA_END=822 /DNA_ORIENTATION=+
MQGEAGAAGSMLHLPLPLPEGHGVQHQGDIVHVTRTCLAPTQQQEEQQQEHQEQQHGEALQQLTPSHHNPTHPTAEVQPGASLSALAARLVLHLPLTRRRAQETMTEGNEELHPSHSPHTSMSLLNFELIMLGGAGGVPASGVLAQDPHQAPLAASWQHNPEAMAYSDPVSAALCTW